MMQGSPKIKIKNDARKQNVESQWQCNWRTPPKLASRIIWRRVQQSAEHTRNPPPLARLAQKKKNAAGFTRAARRAWVGLLVRVHWARPCSAASEAASAASAASAPWRQPSWRPRRPRAADACAPSESGRGAPRRRHGIRCGPSAGRSGSRCGALLRGSSRST